LNKIRNSNLEIRKQTSNLTAMPKRSIIHINIADFAVAVERVLDSRLRGRPVIIAPEGAVRAAVYDMSEEAYQDGVRKGMALRRALRFCRDAAVLPPHPDRYERAMAELFKYTVPYSPRIEMTDHNGHLFIDATGTGRLFGPPPDLASRIRRSVQTDLGFNPIWSVAPNKLLAKVATRIVKPIGEYIVKAGEETAFLGPLPVYLLPGIEQDDVTRLREFNLTRVDHVIGLSQAQLEVVFGNRSPSLYNAVHGIDPSPVAPVGQKQPTISVGHVFGNDTNDAATVESTLYRLIEKAGADLRQRRLAARRIGLVLDYSDGGRVVRQAAAKPATANDVRLFAAAKPALKRAWTRRVRIRCLRLICDRLTYPPAQRELFAGCENKKTASDNLFRTLDAIRHRFGTDAIQLGRTLPA
jgi:DNA polymerase-4